MKTIVSILFILALVACRPVKTTKEYYDEYVNPTASIDYEDTASTDLPPAFLDDYYVVDSKLVRLAEQIDLADSRQDAEWMEAQKAANPWLRHMAFLDGDLLFVAGDDTLGFDPAVRTALEGRNTKKGRFFLYLDGRSILVNVAEDGSGAFKTTLADVDMAALSAEIPATRTVLFAGDHLYADAASIPADALSTVQESTRYSGTVSGGGAEWHWIRSMASDNLIYLFSSQE